MRRTILAVCQFLCRKGQKEKSSLTPTREHLEAVAEVDTRNRNAVPPPAGPSSVYCFLYHGSLMGPRDYRPGATQDGGG